MFSVFGLRKKIKIALILGCIILTGNNLMSQSEFQLTYGQHSGNIHLLHKTSNNNLILLTDYINSSYHILLKTDSVGNIIKRNSYQRTLLYEKKIIEVDDNFYLLSQLYIPITTSHFVAAVVMKLNNNLDILWVKKYFIHNSTNIFYDICASEDAGFLITGHGCAGNNIVIHCDTSGNIIWQKNFASGSPSYLIIKDKKNEYLICSGNFYAPLCIYRINASGALLYYKKFSSIFIMPTSFIKTNDNGYTITGLESDEKCNNIVHLDNELNFVWLKALSYNKVFKINKIVQAENDNYFFSGFIYPNNSPYQNALYGSTDVNGNLFWARTNSDFSINLVDCGHLTDIALSENNHVYLSGWGTFGANLIRIDSHGNGFCFFDTVSFNVSSFNTSIEYPTHNITNTNFSTDTVNYITFNDTLLEKEIMCSTNNIFEHKPTLDTKINVFPNPANREININCENIKNELYFELYDYSGKKVKSVFLNHNFKAMHIDVSNLSKSIYFYSFIDLNGNRIYSGKIIII